MIDWFRDAVVSVCVCVCCDAEFILRLKEEKRKHTCVSHTHAYTTESIRARFKKKIKKTSPEDTVMCTSHPKCCLNVIL